MSKEREAYTQSEVEQAVIHGYNSGHKDATAHYQPLLDAKDARLKEVQEFGANTHNNLMLEMRENGALREQNTALKAQLEAKDAEIARLKESTGNACILAMSDEVLRLTNENTTLKALLEQAREGLDGVIRVADRATTEFDKAKKALAAINAATGEK